MNSRPLTVLAAAVAGLMALAAGPSQAQLMARTPPQGPAPASTPLPPADAADWRTVSPDNLLVIDTTKGRVLVELEPRVAPQSVERIRTLTERGFYNGLKFHRVIAGFMAQTGDPLGTGAGSSDLPNVPGQAIAATVQRRIQFLMQLARRTDKCRKIGNALIDLV